MAVPEKTAPLILSIDDDEDIRSLLHALLGREGYRVAASASGAEGIEAVGRLAPDLVLLDVEMADMDGYTVCERLQMTPGTRSVPVVFLTGHDSEDDRARSVACGAVDRIVKPIDRTELLEKVARHVRTSQQWSAITQGAAERARPEVGDDFERFRASMAERQPEASPARGAVEGMTVASAYDALRSTGMDDVQIAESMASQLGLRFMASIDPAQVASDALPLAFCRKNVVAPLAEADGTRAFAVSNPFDLMLADMLENQAAMQGVTWSLVVAAPGVIASLFEVASAPGAAGAAAVARASRPTIEGVKGPIDPNSPVVFIANNLLATAVRQQAGAISLTAEDGEMGVSIRVDGETRDVVRLKDTVGAMVVARLKEMAGLDVDAVTAPQEGLLEARVVDVDVKLRFVTHPGSFGESMTVRVLDVSAEPKHLRALGFTEAQADTLHDRVAQASGLVLVAGLSDSGRSETVFSLLSSIDASRRSVMTVEDPVERVIPGVTHQQVDARSGTTFDTLVRFAVRHAPDVLFMDKIRDASACAAAVEYASQGHLVIATLTAPDATSAIAVLEGFGVERARMARTVSCIVAQRLVRSLCPDCRRLMKVDDQERAWLSAFTDDVPHTVAHPAECDYCSRGYRGRVGVHEVLDFSTEVGTWVHDGMTASEIRQRVADQGWPLMADSAIGKVRDLMLSPQEANERVLAGEDAVPRTRASASPPPPAQTEQPLPPRPAGAPPPPVPEEKPAVARATRILLADDDEAMTDLVVHVLKGQGYDVETASNGVRALEMARAQGFDLIISDVDMPELDGIGLLTALMDAGVSAPVMMLTAAGDAAVEAEALALGATDYVRKPVRREVLLLRVGRIAGSEAQRSSR